MERVLRTILPIPWIYLALVVQTTLAPRWQIGGACFRCVPLVVYFVLASNRSHLGIVLAAVTGLAADCVATAPLGIETGTCVLMAALVGRWRQQGSMANLAVAVWLLPTFIAIETALVYSARAWSGEQALHFDAVLLLASVGAILTSIPGLLLLHWLPSALFAKRECV